MSGGPFISLPKRKRQNASRAASRDRIHQRRRVHPEVIQLCVRWHLVYKLSYRDPAAMVNLDRKIATRRSLGLLAREDPTGSR